MTATTLIPSPNIPREFPAEPSRLVRRNDEALRWMANDRLAPDEIERYSRQIGYGVLTEAAQLRLKRSTALVTRIGGLGGPAALALVMAGVGRVIVAHAGELESPDLNRQILGSPAGLGVSRVAQFAETLRSRNEFVTVEEIDHEPDEFEAARLAHQADILLSCAADFPQRLRLNRAAYRAGIPFIDAAQWGLVGSLLASDGRRTPCLACAYPDEPPFETHFPVVGAIAATMGNLAALEAIKILSRTGQPLFGQMLIMDGFHGGTQRLQLTRQPGCSVCASPV